MDLAVSIVRQVLSAMQPAAKLHRASRVEWERTTRLLVESLAPLVLRERTIHP